MGTSTESRIRCDIDLDASGRQAGYLRAPLSRNTSGWGTVEIPIVSVKNGSGPTVLFTGGVHGDEYEGQIAVSRLARSLDPSTIQGRVIMIPALNMPAVMNDTRLSPVDNRDMNRCFPGNPRGTFSEMLAHFVDALLLPHVDISVDLHTAGHSGDSALSTNMHYVKDGALRDRTMAAASAFGAPYNVVFWGVDEGATLTSSVERRGILSLGTELGGWGRVNVEGVRIADRALTNILKHFELMDGQPDTRQRDGSPRTRHMMVRDAAGYSFAPANGLFEPRHVVGDVCKAGDLAGLLHFVEDVDRAPIEVRYKLDGVLWMSAGPGRVQRGDAVAVLMEDYDEARAAA
ncbi:MAG: succinylglutamate desuccinylase/aspartoacylase family protein [Chelatococcus sp.]|uniref:succinylglutamate desuccinylase/aspartoacylase family protein n=1 Tax=unclassified Chelatococcus TaxID=2638111 RepID=UPI001BCBCF55|nr:succinylglutamate desuccinylase/aspartoacylase family protein [Chelatococcus sp.]MBS7739630.1 succinylglutamate desuccinylase/aspartoacylase family protein [Chelatococcus sp. HY11]CAH1649653.1 N-alpha-acetyl-L-2,4-diaminobutyrate deacetylase [Hyphomicrobiales bacterium]MBX3537650.1 succinylglutamate desuccinylase/aspartoacylase family protein [Chelatococcus sp.]MBX3543999.1 succinylglutamate desuccinylase/aspartoacylase family protein [Chelatococcus sp.]MCO5075833.1 succinylglutamate desucc